MGKKLSRLQVIRESLPAWQQQAVARIEPAVLEMADYTNGALKFVREHQNHLYSSLNPHPARLRIVCSVVG